jgi:hypothetical protein
MQIKIPILILFSVQKKEFTCLSFGLISNALNDAAHAKHTKQAFRATQ